MAHPPSILNRDDTVIFVGSGISTWSGLPTWDQLVVGLRDFLVEKGRNPALIDAERTRGDLLQAASYGFFELSPFERAKFIRESCRYGIAVPHAIHKSILGLGPTSFITTNYDNLLELAASEWFPNLLPRPPVTNQHLTECAEIISARSEHFIFKPHGDAGDIKSVILTREHYRQLLPGGELNIALESLRTLLSTRPVLYLGFGLRDPDFILVRDLLANVYRGGTLDHYALVADADSRQIDYWRSNYGIHLLNYSTRTAGDRHGELIEVLGAWASRSNKTREPANRGSEQAIAPAVLLALARHAAHFENPVLAGEALPIFVNQQEGPARRQRGLSGGRECVEKFLVEGPRRCVLLGAPGAGKSFAVRKAAGKLANLLSTTCLEESAIPDEIFVPLLADMKLYRGSIVDLIESTLPRDLTLQEIASKFKIKIFVDSFNEMPREYWESGSYSADLAHLISTIGEDAEITIASRTIDGLKELEWPVFELDEIAPSFIREQVDKWGVDVSGPFRHEIIQLLSKPIYYRLVKEGQLELGAAPTPFALFGSYLEKLSRDFEDRFKLRIGFTEVFSKVAFGAINIGNEAIPAYTVLRELTAATEAAPSSPTAEELLNWLVFKQFFVPVRGGRLTFFHQSLTEYLAASELARQFVLLPEVLAEKSLITRWDQSLFLAASFMPTALGRQYVRAVAKVDLALAVRACKYIESDDANIVSEILGAVYEATAQDEDVGADLSWQMSECLRVAPEHEDSLRRLASLGGAIGGVAYRLLAKLGAVGTSELLERLRARRADFNFCYGGAGKALQETIEPADLPALVALVDEVSAGSSEEDEEDIGGFYAAIAHALSGLSVDEVRTAFLLPAVNSGRKAVVCEYLQDCRDPGAIHLCTQLILRGVDDAITAGYFIVKFSGDEKASDAFEVEHVDSLMESVALPHSKRVWALDLLAIVCDARADLKSHAYSKADVFRGIPRMAIRFACLKDDREIFDFLRDWRNWDEEFAHHYHLLASVRLNWSAEIELLLDIVCLAKPRLSLAVLETQRDANLTNLSASQVERLLQRIADIEVAVADDWYFGYLVGQMLGPLRSEAHEWLLEIVNSPDHPLWDEAVMLGKTALMGVTTDEIEQRALAKLISQIPSASWRGETTFLGITATESFVRDVLLPLVGSAAGKRRSAIEAILEEAGGRHGRRYRI